VAPGASATFYQPSNAELPDDFVGAGVMRSAPTQPLGGIVNQVRHQSSMAMAYDTPGGGAAVLHVPLLYRGFAGWNSGLQVQNLGSRETFVTITFYTTEGTAVTTVRQTVESEGALTAYLPSVAGMPRGYIGSAVAVSSDDQPIAAIVNHVKGP
jgi:hypothetical protein